MPHSRFTLHTSSLSLDHRQFVEMVSTVDNLLVIQDLDGVCMGLVNDPLTRAITPEYVRAVKQLDGHFYVLTNGEHVGERGMNGIVERCLGSARDVRDRHLYLPGLAAGGVQWQSYDGQVSHPGVSDSELAFLATVPQRISSCLRQFFADNDTGLSVDGMQPCIEASVLDNVASPTANLNSLYSVLGDRPEVYGAVQVAMQALMDKLLNEAASQGMSESFFVHLAPNLGKADGDRERLAPVTSQSSGTTDFQFMLKGAIKEAGVLALLNRYYHARTGQYPLGETFSVRTAPRTLDELLSLVESAFDPQWMPTIVGVGDTVTSQVSDVDGREIVRRGGSDRNFLQLVQTIGRRFQTGNVVAYVDSSGGEVRNRKSLPVVSDENGGASVLEGPGDPRDLHDPLTLNVVFPGGHTDYVKCFCQAVANRQQQSSTTVGA